MSVSGKIVVVGGCGFLGRHIVEKILKENEDAHVVVLDKVLPRDPEYKHERLQFVQGDICDEEGVKNVVTGAEVVFHTASPPHGLGMKVYRSVNVDGTRTLLDSCIATNVPIFILTSTASVVFDGSDIKGGDETLPYAKKIIDPYIDTKIEGEILALSYNHRPLADGRKLRVCALRPSGIFGPRDAQAWPGFIQAGKEGKSKYLLGDGKNIMDWTYVENLAYAHILAADHLRDENSPVAGEAFFITNDEPIPFWDMALYVWDNMGYRKPSLKIPAFLIIWIAILVDFFCLLLSPFVTIHPTLSYFRVINATAHRYFSIEKAKRLMGYKPPVPLKDGMLTTLHYFQSLPK